MDFLFDFSAPVIQNGMILFLLFIILIICYVLLFQPLRISKDYRDVKANSARNNEFSSCHSSPYPNGWFPVLDSDQVGKNEVKPATFCGYELIICRDGEEKASVLDAYCPHLGAHMGHGGTMIKQNSDACVRCPFHGWSFRASDGVCVDVPYEKVPPNGTKVKVWPCVELNGFIYVWHHCEGKPIVYTQHAILIAYGE